MKRLNGFMVAAFVLAALFPACDTGSVENAANEPAGAGGKAVMPAANPAGGPRAAPVEIESGTTVGLDTETAGAVIYYTTDGAALGQGSPEYGDPVPLSGDEGDLILLKAVAVKPGMTVSDTLMAYYRIRAKVDPPVGGSMEGIDFRAGASLPESAWQGKTGQGTDNITWNLKLRDQRYVYFGVKKTEAQTITPGTADWASPGGAAPVAAVNQEPAEGAIEGAEPLRASGTLALFRVDANKEHNDRWYGAATDANARYDTQFEWNDDFQFTLNVQEGAEIIGTVTVNLGHYDDIALDNALFIVDKASGALTRVAVPKSYKGLASGSAIRPILWEDRPGIRLIDMLVWFDTHYGAFREGVNPANIGGTVSAYQEGAEYLIRVAADETIPCVYLTMPVGDTNTKLRLRGVGGQRVISPTPSINIAYDPNYYYNCTLHNQASTNDALNTPPNNEPYKGIITMRRGILQLEQNITLRGDSTHQSPQRHRFMIHMGPGGTLVMKEGAVIEQHTGNSLASIGDAWGAGDAVIVMSGGSTFKMEGGAIRDNRMCGSVVHFDSPSAGGIFQKTGGVITGNTGKNTETPANIVRFGITYAYTIAGDTTTTYLLP
jgi:hypothetical protein